MKPWQVFFLIAGVALLGITGYFVTHDTTYSSAIGVVDCGSVLSKKETPLLDTSFNGYFIRELNNSSCADVRGKEQTRAVWFGLAALVAITLALFGPKIASAAADSSMVDETDQDDPHDGATARDN